MVPCVRFNCFVWLSTSYTAATLGMGGWLDLAQQGLSPRKKRQASLGAPATKRARIDAQVSHQLLQSWTFICSTVPLGHPGD